MKIRETKYRNIFSKILVVFFTTFLVGCTCLPFSSPSSKTPINGVISYADILTYIGVNASGDPKWDGWVGIADQDQTLNYSISPDSPYVTINKDTGEISVLANALFSNNFTVTATGYGEFQDSVSAELSIKVRPPFLYNVDNVSDDDTLKLSNAFSVTTASLGGTNYLFAAGRWEPGFSVFSVNDDGSLVNVTNVSDTDDMKLNGINSLYVATVAGNDYLFVAGNWDNGVSMFSLGGDGSLINITNIGYDILGIRNTTDVITSMVKDKTYLFVSGYDVEEGVSVLSIDENGNLNHIANYSDNDHINFHGAYSMTTAVVGGNTYLFVAATLDNGLSVFSVGDDGSLKNVYNFSDDGVFLRGGVVSVVNAKVGEVTYLFTANFDNKEVKVFSVGSDGSLVNVHSVNNDITLNLDGVWKLAVSVVEGTTYLFVAGWRDKGVSVFSVGDDGTLENVANVRDNTILELEGASSLATSVVGGTTYLFVSGALDDGVSVFSVNP